MSKRRLQMLWVISIIIAIVAIVSVLVLTNPSGDFASIFRQTSLDMPGGGEPLTKSCSSHADCNQDPMHREACINGVCVNPETAVPNE